MKVSQQLFAYAVAFAGFLSSIDAVLRGHNATGRKFERGLKSSKSQSSSGKSKFEKKDKVEESEDDNVEGRIVGGNDNTPFTTTSPTAAPTKTSLDLDDWIEWCGADSDEINSCIVVLTTLSNPQNCKTCLKSLATISSNPPPADPIPNGVRACARSGMCGQCSGEKLAPFYECGLYLEQNYPFPAESEDIVTDRLEYVTDAPSSDAILEDTGVEDAIVEDTINCPALWPGNGTDCVMIEGYNRKKCIYYEYSADSICSCSVERPIWRCVNGPSPELV